MVENLGEASLDILFHDVVEYKWHFERTSIQAYAIFCMFYVFLIDFYVIYSKLDNDTLVIVLLILTIVFIFYEMVEIITQKLQYFQELGNVSFSTGLCLMIYYCFFKILKTNHTFEECQTIYAYCSFFTNISIIYHMGVFSF